MNFDEDQIIKDGNEEVMEIDNPDAIRIQDEDDDDEEEYEDGSNRKRKRPKTAVNKINKMIIEIRKQRLKDEKASVLQAR